MACFSFDRNDTESRRAIYNMLRRGGILKSGTPPDDNTTELGPIAYLAQLGLIDEAQAISYFSNQLSIPIFTPQKDSIMQFLNAIEDPRLKAVSLSDWRIIHAIPIRTTETDLVVGMVNPLDRDAQNQLEFILGLKVKVEIISEADFNNVLARHGTTSDSLTLDDIVSSSTPASEAKTSGDFEFNHKSSAVFGDDLDSPPVIRLVNKILSDSVERGASDIHIEPEKDSLVIKNRVDGIIHPLFSIPPHLQSPVTSRLKLLSGMDISEKRRPQDGRFRIKTPIGIRDLRVSSVPTLYGETLVIRILASTLAKLDLQALGVPENVRQILHSALKSSSRVVLATGPTGSGKTSTLYSCIQQLADGEKTIVTIEDPIEYRISGITQIQTNHKIGLTFAEGLRTVVRQDPDVVMVGEIRDHETASIAMQVAQTGHLVLSTFHTNSAPSAVTRLRDFGIPSYILSSSLGTIIAQRLVRRLCDHCARPASESSEQRFRDSGVNITKAREAVGCTECKNFGYKGRTGIYSILEITDDVAEAIRLDASESEIVKLAARYGYVSLEDSARGLIESGVTSLDEVERVIGALTSHAKEGEKSERSGQLSAQIDDNKAKIIRKRKVLLVEDSDDTRAVLEMLLQRELYEVITAENGYSGLKKVYEEVPDLIVSDLMMPQMNGLELLQKLRGDPRTSQIPVLMLTAAGDEENELKVISHGADDFVRKGSDTKVLLARVQRLLAKATTA